MNPFKSIINLFKANNAGNESTQQSFSKDVFQSLNEDLGTFVYVDDGFEHQLNGRVEKLTWHEIEKIYAYKTTAFGAALAAAVGIGLVEFDQLKHLWQKDKEFKPEESLSSYIGEKKLLWTKVMHNFYQI